MIRPRYLKVLRDITSRFARNLVLIIAIALGVFAIGTMLGVSSVLNREIVTNYMGTVPASATIKLEKPGIDDALMNDLRKLPDVEQAERHSTVFARMKAGEEWMALLLFVVEDFDNLKTNKFSRISGAWPPPSGTMLVERTALRVMKSSEGNTLTIQLPHGTPFNMKISGVVHDPSLAPAWQEEMGYAYIPIETLRTLDPSRDFDEVRILLKNHDSSAQEIDAKANEIAHWMADRGVVIHEIQVPPPRFHPHQGQMHAVVSLFDFFSYLTLIFAAILTATSIATLMTRQVREIGVMKAIGAGPFQISVLYLFMVFVLSVAAVAIAIPLSRLAAHWMIRVISDMLNLRIFDWSIPSGVLLTQVLSGILIPLIAAAIPILHGSKISVLDALNNYGVSLEEKPGALAGRLRMFGSTFTLALRNVFRHRSRLVMTVALLAAGGAMFMAALNISQSWDRTLAKIYEYRHYDLDVRLAEPIANPDAILQQVKAISGIQSAEAWQQSRMSFPKEGWYDTIRAYPDQMHGSSIMIGVPPGSKLVDFPLLQGRWVDPNGSNEVVLNKNIRLKEDHKPDDPISVSVDGKRSKWRVVGSVDDMGSPGPTGYVPLAFLRQVAGTVGMSNKFLVVFDNHQRESVLQKSREVESVLTKNGAIIASSLPMLDLKTAISEHTTILVRTLLALAILMALVGGLGLASTMSLNVLERTRELGVLRAIGATPKTVIRLVMIEGLLIGAISLLFAFLFSIPLSAWIGTFIGNMSFRMPLKLTIFVPALLGWIALVAVGSMAATFIPARQASKLTPREALAYE